MGSAPTDAAGSEVETQLAGTSTPASETGLELDETRVAGDSNPTGPTSGSDHVPRPGTAVGRYRIIEEVGRGAMGVVYAAYDDRLDRRVALKLLAPGVDADRALEEGRALAKLKSPHVVAVYDAGEHRSQVFLAMEFIRGQRLSDWVAQGGELERTVRAFRDAALGLADAHAANLIHRDFKPDNVMVTDDGRVVVMDFGLAMSSSDQAGTLGAGTPAYMSPEQISREPLTAASDQFSFFVALAEAVEGQRPFQGDTLPSLALAISDAQLDPGALRAMPRWLRSIVEVGLAKDPTKRHPSMARVAKLLDRGLTRRRRLGLALIGTAAVATVAGYSAFQPTAEQACLRRLDPQADLSVVHDVTRPAFRAQFGEAFEAEWSSTVPGFRDFEADWRSEYAASCHAGHGADSELDRGEFRARMDCLSAQLTYVRTLASAAEGADKEGLYGIRAASQELPDPAHCRDADPELSDDSTHRYVVSAASQALAKGDGLWRAGESDSALELLARTAARVDRFDAPRSSAQLHHKRGLVLFDLGRNAQAREEQQAAVAAASRAGDVPLMIRAWAARVALEGALTADPERVDALLEVLRALSPTEQDDPLVVAEYLQAEGDQRRLAGKFSEAQGWYERAQESMSELPRERQVAIDNRLAIALAQQGETQRAREHFEDAWRLEQETWGSGHPRALLSRLNLAKVCISAGDIEASRGHLEAILEHPDFRERAGAMTALARILSDEGETVAARDLLEQAIEHLVAEFGNRSPRLTAARLELFNVLSNSGELEAAHEQALELVAIAEASGAKPTPKTGFAFAALGQSHRQLGNLELAKQNAQRGLDVRREYGATDLLVGLSLVGLAKVELGLGDLERAASLSADALAHLPAQEGEQRGEAWLTLARALPPGSERVRAAYAAIREFERTDIGQAREAYELILR